jgi:hypothetical protein
MKFSHTAPLTMLVAYMMMQVVDMLLIGCGMLYL